MDIIKAEEFQDRINAFVAATEDEHNKIKKNFVSQHTLRSKWHQKGLW